MQVIFIHHSCFLVEVDDLVLIFDYFGGDRVNGFHFTGKIPDYAPDTKIYMFASHKHQDHFDMDILRWSEKYTNVHYILSKDIRISPHFLQKHGMLIMEESLAVSSIMVLHRKLLKPLSVTKLIWPGLFLPKIHKFLV